MKKILFVFLFLIFNSFFAQIRIKELSSPLPSESVNYSNTETRKIISLNKNWNFTPKDSESDGVTISVPSTYTSDDVMVFQKSLNLISSEIGQNNFIVHFLGISYSADIFLNDIIIYKKAGGNIPFAVELPNDIISADGENILKVVVKKGLDSENSIPLFQRFLFPKNSGGIVRDVFLEIIPKENLQLIDYATTNIINSRSAQISLTFSLKTNTENRYRIEVSLFDDKMETVSTKKWNVESEATQTSINLKISNPKFWTPKTPNRYIAEFKLLSNDSLVDLSKKQIIIAKLESRADGIFLNNKKFNFNGVTYIPSCKEFGELISYTELKKDLQIIKELGVNSVRFAKATPHPFALEICTKLGLLPFIEIPLNSPPELIVEDNNFYKRSERFTDEFVKSYSNFSPLFVVGLGSGYHANSSVHKSLVERLAGIVTTNKNGLTYASFIGLPKAKIKNIDLYGVELFNTSINDIWESSLITNNIFISEATYPNYNGNSNGYLNSFSLEAQAKYFEQTIENSTSKKLSGFFLNSMFDYYGDFNSLSAKYSEDNLYKIGILGVDKNINRISYNVIKSKLTNTKRITIPLGNTKDEAPILFIIVGLVLSILAGSLINSKKKLREDATRALLRPYNFFADIRDHRIISGPATIILMLILAGSHSLLIINLLFYFKNNIVFEKILIAFGMPALTSSISYLAWNPTEGFFVFFAISILFFLIISLLISLTSFFIRIKIYFRSIFFTVVWAVLPLALLLPVKMMLYRFLEIGSFNLYIYIFLLLYLLWITRRVIKGVYVIFDISASMAYLYAFVALVVTLGGMLVYFQIYHSTIYYLIDIFNNTNLV